MKRYFSIILVVAVFLSLIGCSNTTTPIEKPASYYYCTDPQAYETLRKTIDFETRDIAAVDNDLQSLLNEYLKGPVSEDLFSPFPDSCTVESLRLTDSNLHIILSSRFARLSGVDLTLACACLSLTVFALSDCQSVTFSVRNVLLDGNKEIIIHRDHILLEYIYS